MVSWYDPGQLVKTALDVVVSTLFTRNADRRLTDILGTDDSEVFDYTKVPDGGAKVERREIVVDYVADTGDGWNSTYAVAYWASRPTLELRRRGPKRRAHLTRRGDVLVFGGDEVYPAASTERYDRRLVAPFETALAWTDPPHPDVFAIPGNHDWYDNLVAFRRRFVSRKWVGGRRTCQTRSYFSLHLPHGWWLIGADVQLESDLDQPQVEFFRRVAAKMSEGDRVILCTAEPHWVYEHEDSHPRKHPRAENNLRFLEQDVFGGRIKLFLAGDQHHYRRHALRDGSVHKITAGGGGAFLHPTNGWKPGSLAGGFELKPRSYPAESRSWCIGLGNLLFPLRNPWFGLLTAVAFSMLNFTLVDELERWAPGSGPLLATMVKALPRHPGALLWLVTVVAFFIAFTNTSSTAYRWWGGGVHGLAHVAAAFVSACAIRAATADASGLAAGWASPLLAYALQFGVGWIAGSLIMGLYLCVSLNAFRRHRNEAFSSLRVQDYKNFLRLVIDEHGDLAVFSVGIERVPRKWRPTRHANGSGTEMADARDARLVPADPASTPPHLIEGPILIDRRPR